MPSNTQIIFAIVAFAIAGGGVYWFVSRPPAANIACTMEAKVCPDGSYVGRVPPSCDFAACPAATSSTATTTGGNGSGIGGIVPSGSGIQGIVLLGPTCPVERFPPDPNCADRPYATLVAVFPANDPVHAVRITESDASGTFSVALPPGDYTLGAGQSALPRCAHPAVTVTSGAYATTTIYCDTGIR